MAVLQSLKTTDKYSEEANESLIDISGELKTGDRSEGNGGKG
jgi:hypothetical protein